MGVHGLWELLAPVGRRVSVETLAGKRLAIDASIWMIQFLKAMRDEKGEIVRNAHILGFFRRICKLLYLRTKPVFVFDGGTPALKRRTVIARRRQRENAQVKIRKTAEKLLLNHLKTMRLQELAADLKKQRQENDIKGKMAVELESVNEPGNKLQGDDNVASSFRQVELDEMLAASIAAEENEGFGIGASTSGAQDDQLLDDDDDGDEEMILPEMHDKVDHAVLAYLPPSMQLDLLVQMRERLMAENRQKYQKVKKAPERFSELQIEAYLKTVAFRREIDWVQKSAAGRGIDGVQTSRIASEPNREFIFSSSFTGDKESLTSVGQERNGVDRRPPPVVSSAHAVNIDQRMKKSDVAAEPTVSESEKAYHDDVESYLDVRDTGISMTRDLQRNVDLRTLMNQEITEKNEKGNNGSPTTRNSPGVPDDSHHINLQLEATGVNNGDKIGEPEVLTGASFEISFEAAIEPDAYSIIDDNLFARLVAGDPITDFSVDNSMISQQPLHTTSDNDWEDGAIEGKSTEYQNVEEGMNDEEEVEWEEGEESQKLFPKGGLEGASALQEVNRKRKADIKGYRSMYDFQENHASEGNKSTECLKVGDMSDEGEIECEEPSEDIQSFSCLGESNINLTKGALEEEAALQEAIRRSSENISVCRDVMDFQEIFSSERAGVMTDESTDCIFADPGEEGPEIFTSADNLHQPYGSMNDLDKINIETTTSSFIVPSPETTNLDSKFWNPSEKGSLAGEVLLGTDTLPVADSKKQPLHACSEDNDGYVIKKPVNFCTEKVVHNMSSSVITGSSHDIMPNSGSAYVKNMSQAKLDVHLISTGNPGKPAADDSGIGVDNLDKDEMDGDFLMETEIKSNDYQDPRILEDRLEGEIAFLGKEREELGSEQRRLERDAGSVNNEMFTECQELLQMFGLPYIIAPMEAEAQCAFMELSNLVDGVVTDDSDAFLFGSQCVYKNIFDDRKYVETYLMKDIENELGLDQEKLIHMALLLGSDYTEGISGVGIVNAIEVVNAFHGKDGLREFREWIESPDPSILGKIDVEAGGDSRKEGPKGTDDAERKKRIFKDKHRNVSKNWHVSSSFPSDAVISAYVSPQVDKSTEPFAWGKPDLFVLRKLCLEKFGWGASKADELLLPVLNEYSKHETQLRLEAFYTFNERFAKIRSKRIEKAVKGIAGSKSSAVMGETPQQSSRKGMKSKVVRCEDEGNQLDLNTAGGDGAVTTTKPSIEPLKKGQMRKRNYRRVLEESIGVDDESRGRRRQRGCGKGKRSGRVKKKTDIGTSYDDASNSGYGEVLQSHTSDEPPQLRRSGRPRKYVNYNVDAPFMEEVMLKGDKEIGGAVKIIDDSLKESGDITLHETDLSHGINEIDIQTKNGDNALEETDLTHGMGEIDIRTREDPSGRGQESNDYLQFGGGFCMNEDDEDGHATRETMLDYLTGADLMLKEDRESNTSRPSDEGTGMPDNELDRNNDTSRSDTEGEFKRFNMVSLRAMPNLRKKRRKK
ncbi:DNA repair protein UVH3 isoform X1 [Salvia splendens]|uniref:DNA repair protein UVH3 isoform X1 n=3 Tax=Salvia splendens TaxID=180675 RepID=UPI001C270EAA|nr:DNA repair protein UVH3 isoform X1 [Salvia splendens]